MAATLNEPKGSNYKRRQASMWEANEARAGDTCTGTHCSASSALCGGYFGIRSGI